MLTKLLNKLRGNKQQKTYEINPGYKINSNIVYCDKRQAEPSKERQKEVYEKALKIAREKGYKSILDIGCGSGWKLQNYFGEFKTLGLEIPETLTWLKENRPTGNWGLSDFSSTLEEPYEVIICADVIEHLDDPDNLIDFILRVDFKVLILSTPERNAIQTYQKGHTWNGPPKSKMHVREWTYDEFDSYMSPHFDIIEHYYDCPTECEKKEKVCQVIVATRRSD